MSHYFKNVNLSSDPFNVRLILNLILLKDFDGDFLASQDVRPETDLAESALAERPTFALGYYSRECRWILTYNIMPDLPIVLLSLLAVCLCTTCL